MTADRSQIAWRLENVEELDREIARLCLVCQVRILDPGIIERALTKDVAVCGTSNPVAFAELRNMFMFHFANRQKSVDAAGKLQTPQIEARVVEQLRSSFADLLGK